jgi:hypothetical protein
MSPAAFSAKIEKETKDLADVVAKSNITAE